MYGHVVIICPILNLTKLALNSSRQIPLDHSVLLPLHEPVLVGKEQLLYIIGPSGPTKVWAPCEHYHLINDPPLVRDLVLACVCEGHIALVMPNHWIIRPDRHWNNSRLKNGDMLPCPHMKEHDTCTKCPAIQICILM